ncbi:MFS transporter [Plantactinospora endophytica]|uniref:MFS transporter n=1 Tax=Plantactinospora endophytica TaxID=673535 RepID=A0ABQ4EE80_9ACTN|nr:MFS transporter [Plantactinospora endophytica]GIG92999.1 MFS transporter [Plantactinospora endophytica]
MSTEVDSTARPMRPGWALGLVSICAFLTALDVMVVVTALPTIRTEMGASLADLEWTVNAYTLAFACLLLTGAALGDRFGRRRMYVIGLVVFTAASVVAAMSTTVEVLIIGRVLLGIGAALCMPVSLTLLTDAFPPHRRGMAMGVWGSVSGLAVAAGPVVGGLITQVLSWPWIFWLNVPLGLGAALLSALLLRESRGPRPRLDLTGLTLVSLGLFGLTWALVRGPNAGWASSEVLVTAVGGALLLLAFVAWERHTPQPMLPLSYFRNQQFAVVNIVAFFQHFALIGSLFMLAQLFQVGLGDGPMAAGLHMLPWTLMPLLVAPIVGRLADRYGNWPFMTVGLLLQGISLIVIAWLAAPGMAYGSLILPMIIGGVGITMSIPTVINAVFGSVPQNDIGVASGTNSAVREVGAVFGVVCLSAMFIAYGSYDSPEASIDGFQAALILGGAASIVGAITATFSPERRRLAPAPVHAGSRSPVESLDRA